LSGAPPPASLCESGEWSLSRENAKYLHADSTEDRRLLRPFLEPCTKQQTDAGVKEEGEGEGWRAKMWLGAALRYLDVVDLGRATMVCTHWNGEAIYRVYV
jgi:hypothetical protein